MEAVMLYTIRTILGWFVIVVLIAAAILLRPFLGGRSSCED